MKSVGGVEASAIQELPPLVLRRGETFLVFRARGVENLDEFNSLCPPIDPKTYGRVGKHGWELDPDAPALRDAITQRNIKHYQYLVIKTLEPSQIDWDKINLHDPDTWKFLDDELRGVLSYTEINALLALVDEANALDPEKLEANRESFLLQQAVRLTTVDRLSSCPSGEVAST
jgi:hypothetical protein